MAIGKADNKGSSSTSSKTENNNSVVLVVTDEDTSAMASPESVYSGHINGVTEKVMTLLSTNQMLTNKRRQRKRMDLSDFDSMDDDEAADYALMEEEEKLMMKDETVADRLFMGSTMDMKGPVIHEINPSTDESKESNSSFNKDDNGPGVWNGTRARKLIGKPLPPPPTILVKIPEVANPIFGGTPACPLKALDLKGPSTTINTILSFKRGPQSMESVPNPILQSPHLDRSETVPDLPSTSSDIIEQKDEKPREELSPQLVASLHHSCPPDSEQTKSDVNREQENVTNVTRGRSYSVSFSFTESRDSLKAESSQSHLTSSIQPTRRRAFSIDIESADNFTELGMDPSWTTSYHISSGLNLNDMTPAPTRSKESSDTLNVVPRDRGLSFELFSFGMNEFDAAPLYPSFDEGTAHVFTRPRGDSIIFDPISFNDGGIHEINALRRARRNSISSDVDEVAIMNTPGFLEAPVSECIVSMAIQTSPSKYSSKSRKLNGPSSSILTRGKKSECSQSNLKRKEKGFGHDEEHYRKIRRGEIQPDSASVLDVRPDAFYVSTISMTLADGSPNGEETIHMPQGSQAAAAAAMLFHPQAIPVAMNGTISHTSFPLALLNKDGRIGIYLPEARKERIAKFHSKRQRRTWRKKIKYDCRKKLADSRPRVKGRFVKSSDDGE